MYRDVLVDAATWHRAQRNMRPLVQSKRKHEWPLGGGALRCECETPLSGLTGNLTSVTGKKRCYYQCRDPGRAHGHAIKAKFVVHRKERIEAQFVALLHELTAFREPTACHATDAGATDESERELRKRAVILRTKVCALPGRWERLFAALEDGAMDPADFAQRLAQLKKARIARPTRVRSGRSGSCGRTGSCRVIRRSVAISARNGGSMGACFRRGTAGNSTGA